MECAHLGHFTDLLRMYKSGLGVDKLDWPKSYMSINERASTQLENCE